MTDGQLATVCPQCGSTAAVHSIRELAAWATDRLGERQPGFPSPQQPVFPDTPQPSGFPSPQQDWFGPAQQSGFPPPQEIPEPPPQQQVPEPPQGFPPPAPQGFPPPAPQGFPPPPSQEFPPPPAGRRSRPSGSRAGSGSPASWEDDLAEATMGATARFIGRAIGRRVQRTLNERVLPAMAARQQAAAASQEAMLANIEIIAERHPDLRACLSDNVIFLAGGSRVLPMPGLAAGITVEQSDALVARLRDG